MKPGNKNQMLGDFEFVVDYASMIPVDTVSEILYRMVKNKHTNNPVQIKFHNPIESDHQHILLMGVYKEHNYIIN